MKRIACLADIVIDREAMVARFGTWGIPAVTLEIENALKSYGNEGVVMSCQCARNQNNPSLITENVVSHRRARRRNVDSLTQTGARNQTNASLTTGVTVGHPSGQVRSTDSLIPYGERNPRKALVMTERVWELAI